MLSRKQQTAYLVPILVIVPLLTWYNSLAQQASQPDTTNYCFESDVQGWIPQDYINSQSIMEAVRSDSGKARFGHYSLELKIDSLIGGHKHKSQGEAYVDLRSTPPAGVKAPLNLENRPITVWVYVPEAAAGNPNKPNGVQVFVKDQNWKCEYGTWKSLPGYTDRWISIQLKPSKKPPPMGYMDLSFDPTKVIIIGVKIGTGTGSRATYNGSIWIDGVNWE